MPTKKNEADKPTPANKQKGKKVCPCCHEEKKITDYYISKSPLYSLDGRVPICKDCMISNSLNEDGSINEVELNKILRQADKPYFKDSLASAAEQFLAEHSYIDEKDIDKFGEDILKLFYKNIAMRQTINLSYADSEKLGFIYKNSNTPIAKKKEIMKKYSSIIEDKENCNNEEDNKSVRWSKKDKQNMNYVISTVGYDPFEDLELSDSDRKYCFNIMSGYCDTEGIVDDGNKMQGVIEMTNMYCQCKNFTAAINAEMNSDNPNDQKISRLTTLKTSMLSSISTIAKDNNISSNYNKNSKQGQSSLTSKMKEMSENNFQAIEVNLFDIKTSEAFKQIDEISNTNIANQLTLDNNDYTEIVKEQREMIQKYDADINELKEENRMLKNKIIDLENGK